MKSSRIFNGSPAPAILAALFILLLQTLAVPSLAVPNTVQDKVEKKVFTDEDLTVEKLGGRWGAQTALDLKQAYDPTVPVFVKFLNTFYGKDKYLGLIKVSEAELENRSSRLTRAAQLRWIIVSVDNPEAVVLEGLTPFFEVQIEPYSVKRMDIPEIYFNKIVKPLLKDGEISGHLRLVVGVQEVRFADGTAWQRTQQAALLRDSYQQGALKS